MRAALSIIIPTLNVEADLAQTLASLMEGVHAGLIRELVVCDSGSTDDTIAMAQNAGAVVVTATGGRGAQLAHGAEQAQGAWFLFLHADTQLSEGWSTAVDGFLQTQQDAGYGDLLLNDTSPIAKAVSAGANLRSRLFGLPYGDQGLLISRDLYHQIGGYSDMPLMEDVAIAQALKGRLKRVGFRARTSATRYQTQGYLKRIAGNWMLLIRYKLGADPKILADEYRNK